MRSDLGNPKYDLDTMIDSDVALQPEEGNIDAVNPDTPPTLDQALEIAKGM